MRVVEDVATEKLDDQQNSTTIPSTRFWMRIVQKKEPDADGIITQDRPFNHATVRDSLKTSPFAAEGPVGYKQPKPADL